jgi:hypothetical protein
VIGRYSRDARNFLMRFEGKELSLTREWFIKKIREKYLKEPPGWILGTIKRELNLSELTGNPSLKELHDHHDTTLMYWR